MNLLCASPSFPAFRSVGNPPLQVSLELVWRRLPWSRHPRKPVQGVDRLCKFTSPLQPASGRFQSRLVHGAARFSKATVQSVAVGTEYGGFLPASGLLAQHVGELIANGSLLRLLHGSLPADLTLRSGSRLVFPALSILQRSRLDLPENDTQYLLKYPRLPITPAPRPTGPAMVKLDNKTRRALRIRGLRELLFDRDAAREAVDNHGHSALASRVIRPNLPHVISSPHRLSRQPLQHQKSPAPQHRRHHQVPLVVPECSHSRLEGTQPRRDRNDRCVGLRPQAV